MISVQLPPNLKYVQDNSFRACTNLTSLEIPATVNTLARGCFRDMKCPVIILATTPPSLNTYDNQNTCTFYVPNESVVTYRGTSEWSSLRGKIHGFVSGPIEIMKDGQYQYKLQSCFSGATNFSLTIQDNEYLGLEFSDDTGIVTATGITSETEDTSVRMNYEFTFKGVQHSGTFEIVVKYREVIDFEDAEVKRICVANWGGEYSSSTNKYGVPGELTYEQAAAVSSIGTVFNSNKNITKFCELKYFTSVHSINNGFTACTGLIDVDLNNITSLGTGALQSSGIIYVDAPLVTGVSQGSASTGWAASTYSLIGCLWKKLSNINTGGMYNSRCKYHIFLMESPPTVQNGLNRWTGTTYVPDVYMNIYQENSTWGSRVRSLSQLPTDYPDCPWLDDLRQEGFIE